MKKMRGLFLTLILILLQLTLLAQKQETHTKQEFRKQVIDLAEKEFNEVVIYKITTEFDDERDAYVMKFKEVLNLDYGVNINNFFKGLSDSFDSDAAKIFIDIGGVNYFIVEYIRFDGTKSIYQKAFKDYLNFY